MRMLLIYILFVAFGCQQTPFLETENLKTSETEKRLRANDKGQKSESRKDAKSQSDCLYDPATAYRMSVDCCPLTVDYHESQIRLADSLYKNYLPQYNFEEVKKAVEFLESENLKTSETEKRIKAKDKGLKSESRKDTKSQSDCLYDPATAYRMSVDCCPLTVDYYENQIRLADSLYKNYLPQYNFDEVKAAMEFFDNLTADNRQQSTDNRLRARKTKCTEDTRPCVSTGEKGCYPRTVDCCLLTVDIEFSCAKAHYYHAVGLTERDDVVGACEHYLRALEIMEIELETENLKTSESEKRPKSKDKSLKSKEKREKVSVAEPVEAPSDDVVPSTSSGTACSKTVDSCPLSVDNPQDYEKLRFLALIYNRLGRLFYNENYCELAITKYRKALKYVEMIDEKSFKANVLKELGNSYQLANVPDSALYYYNESLRYNSNLPNKLDIEKSIAKILLYKGEKDSAYVLLKNNLRVIDNGNLKYSYHHTIGNMFYVDKEYDSALYYLESSLDDDILTTRLAFCTTLSSIYDSLGNREKKAYYDNFSSKLLIENLNKEMVKSKVQILYNNYKERKLERDNAYTKKRTARMFSMVGICVIVIVTLSLIYTRYNHRKHSSRLENEIDDYRKNNDKKDEIIEMQNKELQNLIKEKECCSTLDLEAYYNSDICKSILEKKEEKYIPLSVSELSLLLDAANDNLDNIINKLKAKYPKLNTNDMYYICLIMLNVSKSGLSYLLNRSRKTIWERTKRIKTYMNLGDNEDLFLFFKNNEWCK